MIIRKINFIHDHINLAEVIEPVFVCFLHNLRFMHLETGSRNIRHIIHTGLTK